MIYNYILSHGFPTEILYSDQETGRKERREPPCHAPGHPREGTGNPEPYLSQVFPYDMPGEVTKLGRGAGAA